jgi:hypothetical protein
MLNDTKSTFKYRPSFATDIRKTFKRARKAMAEAAHQPPGPPPAPVQAAPTHVVPMRKRRTP